MDEIEDAVPARIAARDEGGPGYRALRRHGCSEPIETSLPAESIEVRQGGPMPFEKRRIHSIDSEYDYFRGCCPLCSVLTAQAQQRRRDCEISGCVLSHSIRLLTRAARLAIEYGFTFHPIRNPNSEQRQRRGRKILNAGVERIDGAI